MAEASADTVAVKIIGPLITAVIGVAIGWLGLTGMFASAVTALLGAICGLAGLAFHLMYQRYVGVLASGGSRKGSPARGAYDQLRGSFTGGNIAERVYAERLTAFLNAVDRFFGDAGMADQTLFPHAFGLRTPAPLWTAPAYDRCLLLALIYPITTIVLIWTLSGHVGPAEASLGLPSYFSSWQRVLSTAAIGCSAAASWRVFFCSGGWSFLGWSVLATALAMAVGVALRPSAADGIGITIVAVVGVARFAAPTFAGVTIFTITVLYIGMDAALAGPNIVGWALAAVGVVLIFLVAYASERSYLAVYAYHRRPVFFFLLFTGLMILIIFGAAIWLSPLKSWDQKGPALLFLGLLTLINSPFDWASLGLTRALLRRGLELGGWWPYFLAVMDAILAGGIIALLAITTLLGVQTFDHLAELGGGRAVLSLNELFKGLETHPSAPEYWWLYALLLSTMIPSLINLMIGGASLLGGVPGLPAILLRFMPAGKAVPQFDRSWIALVLAGQVFAGAILGIAAQAFLAVGVIFYILPWVGLGLLETARVVAGFDMPGRVLSLLWGGS